MPFHSALVLAGAGSIAALAAAVVQFQSTTTSGPVRYTMDAATLSGMSAIVSSGGGFGAIMGMMSSRASDAVKTLDLRPGASRAASPSTSKPRADHFMPRSAGGGTWCRCGASRARRAGPARPMA